MQHEPPNRLHNDSAPSADDSHVPLKYMPRKCPAVKHPFGAGSFYPPSPVTATSDGLLITGATSIYTTIYHFLNAVSMYLHGTIFNKNNSVNTGIYSPVSSLLTETSYATLFSSSSSVIFFIYSRLWMRPQIMHLSPTWKVLANRAFLPQQIQGI